MTKKRDTNSRPQPQASSKLPPFSFQISPCFLLHIPRVTNWSFLNKVLEFCKGPKKASKWVSRFCAPKQCKQPLAFFLGGAWWNATNSHHSCKSQLRFFRSFCITAPGGRLISLKTIGVSNRENVTMVTWWTEMTPLLVPYSQDVETTAYTKKKCAASTASLVFARNPSARRVGPKETF